MFQDSQGVRDVRFTAMTRARRGKLAMATAAFGIGLLSLTGCGYINPQQTTEQYSASDGTRTDLGPLQLRNMMIISDGGGKPGSLVEVTIREDGTNADAKFKMPVLDASITDYKKYLPTAEPTSSGKASGTATPTPTP